MNAVLQAELEKLNEAYPFRVFELQTLNGHRIRVTQRFRKLYGSEEGDIRIDNGVIAFLRYDQLEDIIYLVPPWKRPFGYIWNRPELLLVGFLSFELGLMAGCHFAASLPSRPTNTEHVGK